jgi:hypothetical protein
MKSALIIAFLVLFAATAAFIGCSNQSGVEGNANDPWLVSIYPTDGAEHVSPVTALYMKFVMPMDTSTVHRNIFLSGGPRMHMWADSLNHYGGMRRMSMGMREHMLKWMDSIEWGGQWHWNKSLDSCEFIPDSSLLPGTEYLIMVNEDGIIGHNGHNMFMGHTNEDFSYYHFKTEMYPISKHL